MREVSLHCQWLDVCMATSALFPPIHISQPRLSDTSLGADEGEEGITWRELAAPEAWSKYAVDSRIAFIALGASEEKVWFISVIPMMCLAPGFRAVNGVTQCI